MIHVLHHDAPSALLERVRLRRLLEVLNDGEEETRIVGGAIRNALLGREVTEIDLASTAIPERIEARARAAGMKTVPTGIDHGTVTVIVAGEPFEVTTLRQDVETDGRRAVVHFGRDFAADALRRDFTMNALSLGLDGVVRDYTGGVADLAARRVRFIGDAHTRIREDYLRILRFFRFFAEYAENAPDPEGLAAAGAERAGLGILSRERIRHELMKIIVARRSVDTIRILAEHGFLTWLLGGVAEFGRFERVVASEGTAIRRLAALAVLVPEDADRLQAGLRLSNAEHRQMVTYGRLLAVLKGHADPLCATALRRLVADYGVEPLAHVLSAVSGESRPALSREARSALSAYLDGTEPVPVFPVRGADFVNRGVPKGPLIGELMARARDLWMRDGCPTDRHSTDTLVSRILTTV